VVVMQLKKRRWLEGNFSCVVASTKCSMMAHHSSRLGRWQGTICTLERPCLLEVLCVVSVVSQERCV